MQALQFPPLAGVTTYGAAAREGYSVHCATALLHRFAYVKQRLAIMSAAQLPSTPEWEVKGALALHGWLDAEHAAALYRRIAELRQPPPTPHDVPDEGLETALDEALTAATTAERIVATYGVLRPAFVAASERYLDDTNPLCDQPSCRLLRIVLAEEREIASWGDRAVAVVRAGGGESARSADRWSDLIRDRLAAAGGMTGAPAGPDQDTASPSGGANLQVCQPARDGKAKALPHQSSPTTRRSSGRMPSVLPARDERFRGTFDSSTPADLVYLDERRPPDERNAALLFKRLREMDVPEVIAGIVFERWLVDREAARQARGGPGTRPAASPRPLLPWSYYADMLRQMWDEARHSTLGEVALERLGVDWRRLPINMTFSYKLARYCNPIERHILLYAIEQSLMPRARGKPYEHAVARDSGDRLSALFHDFDWADEVLHVEIARRCLRPDLPGGLAEARERADALWQRIADGLEREPLPQETSVPPDWWRDYARQVTGREVEPVRETHVKDWRPLSSG